MAPTPSAGDSSAPKLRATAQLISSQLRNSYAAAAPIDGILMSSGSPVNWRYGGKP